MKKNLKAFSSVNRIQILVRVSSFKNLLFNSFLIRMLCVAVLFTHVLFACSTGRKKVCSEGGQPARAAGSTFKGIKRCYQVQDSNGKYVNDGKYYEWTNQDQLALEGTYDMGKKTGRWIEYDEKGKKVLEEYFVKGVQIPAP